MSTMWICCQCGDGPKVYINQSICIECHHHSCGGQPPYVSDYPKRAVNDIEVEFSVYL
ncbi:hypothetical protein BJX99DRAFT_217433 [Aspergillus californicus]